MTKLEGDAPGVSLMAVRGTVLPRIAPEVALYVAAATVVAALHEVGWSLPISPLAHSIVGIALGMLLVFRTNVSYDRFWEARRRLSGIGTAARNLCRAVAHTQRGDELARLVSAYVFALRGHLEGTESWRELRRFLPEDEIRAAHASGHAPLALARNVTGWIRVAQVDGTIDDQLASSLEGYVSELVDHQGACERILTTPVPYAYMTHVRQLLAVYLLTLPLALVSDLGPWSIAAVGFVAFGLLGIDRAGREIEDPFGSDPNDLPLGQLAEQMVVDLGSITGSARR